MNEHEIAIAISGDEEMDPWFLSPNLVNTRSLGAEHQEQHPEVRLLL